MICDVLIPCFVQNIVSRGNNIVRGQRRSVRKPHIAAQMEGPHLAADGVAEATNAQNELFGTDRMLQALNRNPDAMPEEVLSNVMDGINAFVAGAQQFDDITMLCLKYNG